MYRQDVRCSGTREEIQWKKTGDVLSGIRKIVTCNNETGYLLISHDTGKTLVEARRKCPLCGMAGVNEEALLWDRMPAASSYRGPTVYQMALGVGLDRSV
jgi:hypothetical protein